MGGLALEVDVVPVQAEDPLGCADDLALPLQHRALLDVVLVVGVQRERPAGLSALVADALQLVALLEAVDVRAVVGPLQIQRAGPDAG
jgi:hypothetical protein